MHDIIEANPGFHPPQPTGPARAGQSAPTAIDFVLPATPTQIAVARRQVTTCLAHWNLDRLADDAALITSELVTNAVLHAEAETITVFLVRCGTPASPKLLITVTDTSLSECMPSATPPAGLEESGRGLYILTCLTTCWGTVNSKSGKLVWAMLGMDAQ
ncbi:ATP-binding protein [Streptomyces nigra]|uniref:ATP-binding protein n=1 Tax=Streptomyces nigra TaxID=1827580 RepID=UPI00366422E6